MSVKRNLACSGKRQSFTSADKMDISKGPVYTYCQIKSCIDYYSKTLLNFIIYTFSQISLLSIYIVFNKPDFISLFLEYELYVRSNQGLNYDILRSYTLDITCVDQRRNDSSVFYIYLLRNKPPRFLNLQGILIINKPPICNIMYIVVSYTTLL